MPGTRSSAHHFPGRPVTAPVGETRPLWRAAWSRDATGWPWTNTVIIIAPGDGSCLFHALLNAFSKSYRLEVHGGIATSREAIVRGLRKDLAVKLGTPINPLDPDALRPYDYLAGGNMEEFARKVPEMRLENMQRELDSTASIGHGYMEYIGNEADKDIYILRGDTGDVYFTGEEGYLHKGRDSVVLCYFDGGQDYPGHYDLLGYRDVDGTLATHFAPGHPFIIFIRQRFDDVRSRTQGAEAPF